RPARITLPGVDDQCAAPRELLRRRGYQRRAPARPGRAGAGYRQELRSVVGLAGLDVGVVPLGVLVGVALVVVGVVAVVVVAGDRQVAVEVPDALAHVGAPGADLDVVAVGPEPGAVIARVEHAVRERRGGRRGGRGGSEGSGGEQQ